MVGSARLVSTSTNIPALVRWGVSAHADLVYRALVSLGPQAGNSLARYLQLPVKTVLSGLDELSGLDAAQPQPARTSAERQWRANPPDAVVRTLRSRQVLLNKARHQLLRQLSTLDIVRMSAEDLRSARPIVGVPAVRGRLAELVDAERTEHLAMNPEPAFTATSAKAGLPASRAALKRGVTAWTLGVPAATEDQSEPHTRELYTYGLQYRELPYQPIKMMIMDRTTAFLPLNPAALFSHGVWEIAVPAVVDQLVSFFLQQWSKAAEPNGRRWVPPAALSDRERAILALLADGATDAAAAAKLDLSVRTIAYTIRDLMERYEVRTRFQLGLVLGAQTAQHAPDTTDGEDTQ